MAFLETTDLCRRYGEGDAAVLALNSVSLSVEKGQFAAVTGRSGSGKSTQAFTIVKALLEER